MIHQTLQQVFGYREFRPGQEAVVSAVMAGRSAAAIFPTGSGKSLCYQVPALHLPHLTLVVSPLLALMQDQLAFLQRHGIPAASIDSAQDRDETRAVMTGVKRGDIKILMISVERLKNERFRHFIAQVPISLLVVDEAHCLSEWGHNFRPDYLKLPDYQRQFAIPQVLLLTATATPPVIEDMQARFAIAPQDVVTTGFYRPNLNLSIEPVAGADKLQRLSQWLTPRLQAGQEQSTIVYVTLQKTAEHIATQLQYQGIRASAYHAGLPSEQRERLQQQFMAGTISCIVATIAFGMGIDKSDIRNVVHFDLPKSIENYSQEIGRAGRDGQPADCLVLANRDAVNVLENFIYGDTPEREGIATVLDDIAAAAQRGDSQWEVVLNTLSQQSNIRPLPLKTLLVQLELGGFIAPRYSYFAEYRFKYLNDAEQIVARFEGERRQFVEAIFFCATRAKTWCTLDFEALYHYGQKRSINTERSRIISALDYFHAKGWIALESKQMTEVYQLLGHFSPAQLSAELHTYFKHKETSEIQRIHAMLALFETDHCLSHRLASYFGDEQAPVHCGHCSVCRGHVTTLPAPPALPALADQNLAALCHEFVTRHQTHYAGQAPGSDRLTHFLLGLSMPLFTRLKARNLPGFGQLEAYPYAEVARWVATQVAQGSLAHTLA